MPIALIPGSSAPQALGNTPSDHNLSITPTNGATVYNISGYLLGVSIRRTGRNRELDRMEASTAVFRLDNQDRRFDPTNTAGPYYGGLTPNVRVTFTVTHGYDHMLFHGFVDSWPMGWDTPNVSDVEVTCTDGFKIMRSAALDTDLPAGQMAGEQIIDCLEQMNWPAVSQIIEPGQSEMQPLTLEAGQPVWVLERIQQVAAAEAGVFFVDGEGRARFQDRHTRLLPPYTVSQATLGDGANEYLYDQLVLSYDDQLLYNDVRVTQEGGDTYTGEDATSQSAYGRRTLAETVIVADATDAESRAGFLLGRYKDPHVRVEQVTLKPVASPTYWTLILQAELGDRITVKRRPPGGGDPIIQDCHIEGVVHDWTGGPWQTWTTRWALAPADENTYWLLEDTVNGVLDTTTIPAY